MDAGLTQFNESECAIAFKPSITTDETNVFLYFAGFKGDYAFTFIKELLFKNYFRLVSDYISAMINV